jgi:hypothetical protein
MTHKIVITDPVRLRAAIEFANDMGCLEQFGADLCRLLQVLTSDMIRYPERGGEITCNEERRFNAEIVPDWAPHSFGFAIWDTTKSNEKSRANLVLNGGWIYSGPGVPSDGSFPSLCVSLDDISGRSRPTHTWRCHT